MSKFPEIQTTFGPVDVLRVGEHIVAEIITQYSPNSNDIDCCIQNMYQTIEQLRAENERLKRELVTLREYTAVTAWNIGMDIHIKSKGLLQDAREVGSKIAASIRKKEPSNEGETY